MDVVSEPGGRRRWTREAKAGIIGETLQPGANVADVARRYGLVPQQIYAWRSAARARETGCGGLSFVPVSLDGAGVERGPFSSSIGSGDIVVQASGLTVHIPADVSADHIERVLCRQGFGVIIPPGPLRVMVATRPVDFRKGAMGLAALVEHEFAGKPFSGTAWVFRSKRANRIKLLVWDGTGLVLVSKVLQSGNFHWPRPGGAAMRMSAAQASALFEGLQWTRMHRYGRRCRCEGGQEETPQSSGRRTWRTTGRPATGRGDHYA